MEPINESSIIKVKISKTFLDEKKTFLDHYDEQSYKSYSLDLYPRLEWFVESKISWKRVSGQVVKD